MAQIDKPGLHFNTLTWTGDGNSSRNITGVGFQPDWVWGKCTSTTVSHALYDAVRGGSKLINSDTTSAEGTNAALSAFISDGFTVNSDSYFNANSNTYVAWNWLAGGTASSNSDGSLASSVSANTTAGFSIVKYTGNATNSTVGHGLGVTPQVLIVKNLDSTGGSAEHWRVQHHKVAASKVLYLNRTNAEDNNGDFQSTYPGSSTFSISSADGCNKNGEENIAYCFAEKKGYSKFGSYTGNGNAEGTFVYTGFRPAWVMVKRTDTTGNWLMYDNKRNTFNLTGSHLAADENRAESTESTGIDFVSNGIKMRNTFSNLNASSGTYIYLAFAEFPFVTSGTKAAGTAR